MKCKPAVAGFEIYAPIIDALEKYNLENSSYPDSLDSLVPEYLSVKPVPNPNGRQPSMVEYEKNHDEYKLMFEYLGPGINICTYSPSNKWNCYGYY
ncbi:MAG: hypothetical protein OEV42_18100 [Deltaproteobacteria bacterium]|nr:hypothetical protein [Deltaproteobacteria bacterium]